MPKRISEEMYRILIENSPVPVSMARAGRHLYVNSAFASLFGYDSPEELFGSTLDIIIAPSHGSSVMRYNRLRESGSEAPRTYESVGKKRNGLEFPIEIHVSTVELKEGTTSFGSIIDISRQAQATKKLEDSLRDKEILLRELHHRTKNNMAVISSILSLKSMQIADPAVVEIFRECQQRILSMSLVHDKLYDKPGLSRIDTRQYLKSLSESLLTLYTGSLESQPEISIKITEGLMLGADKLMPLGLIINEALSNSLKHAFKDATDPKISIMLHNDNQQYKLVIYDNGMGLPPGYSLDGTSTLGTEIIRSLTEQLEGSMELKNRFGGGTELSLSFS